VSALDNGAVFDLVVVLPMVVVWMVVVAILYRKRAWLFYDTEATDEMMGD
jgi:hypothetical protein